MRFATFIAANSSSGGKGKTERLIKASHHYITKATALSVKVKNTKNTLPINDSIDLIKALELDRFAELLDKHIDLVERRLIKGEKILHDEKIFSLFEQYTEWVTKHILPIKTNNYKHMKSIFTLAGILFSISLFAQTTTPDLSKFSDESVWKVHNRTATIFKGSKDNIAVKFDAQKGDGLATFQNLEFENGTIEFYVKGKDVLQRSFVGLAFHIQNDSTFNAVYFRPFNFKKPERSGHSVQYICHPEFTWRKLRTDFPGQFENPVKPVPNPNEFFHAKVIVKWPIVSVFVEKEKEPSLEVKMKSKFKKGKVGFWVGFGSDGEFKNLIITSN